MRRVILLLAFAALGFGQPVLTTVADTIYAVDAGLASGSFTIRLNVSCVAPGGYHIGTLTSDPIQLSSAGTFSKALFPNDTCQPANTSYRVHYNLYTQKGTPSPRPDETWVVTTSVTPLTIENVRVTTTPTPSSTVPFSSILGVIADSQVPNLNVLSTGLTPSRAVITDAGSLLSTSSTTSTEIGYVNGVTSAIQTQLNAKVTSVTGTTNEIASTGGLTPVLSIAPTFNITGKTSTAPIKTGTTPPATCGVGEYFYDTDATVGRNTYACTSTNTWTLQGDGAGSPGFDALTTGTNTTATMTVGSGAIFQANNATRTAPMKSGTAAPGTCTVGDYFYDSDATVGQNTYACTSTNVWTLQGDGGGGGGGVANYETSFSAQTSVTITGATHGFAHRKILIEVYDNSTPRQRIVPSLVTVDSTSFDVVVTFAASTTGLIMLNGSGGAGTVTNAAALTLDLPVFGAGSNGIKVGTKTGTGIEAVMSQNPTVVGPLIGNLAEASCDSTLRGKITVVQGGAGVGDTARICIKTDADTYIWRPIV